MKHVKLFEQFVNDVEKINESTHAAFGIIDKKGKISSAYIHADGYPDHMIPIIKKYFKTSKAVQSVVDKGGASQLNHPSQMRFYNEEPDTPKTRGADTMDANKISNYLKFADNNYGAEFIYLYDDRDGKWKYAEYKDDELRPLQESSLNEAKSPARSHKLYKKLLKYFKDDYWDEIRDMARRAREYHTEYDLDMLDTNPKAPQPLDFRKLKSNKEWNEKGKAYILDMLDKMGEQAVDAWFDDFDHWLK